ncbi:Translation initiation factor [Dirofilaria immitis]
MKNNRKNITNPKSANVSDVTQKTSWKNYTSKQSTIISSTQKSDSGEIQSIEVESKRSNPTETSSKTDKLLSKKLTKYDFGSSEEEKPISNMEEKFADEKFKDDKIEIVSMKHQVPSLPSIHINSTQDLPDFAHEELQISTPENFKPIAQNLIKRKMKSTKSSKAERISYEKTNQLLQSKDFEKDSLHKYCFPSCMQYTFLRLIALILLFCAWIIVYAFPCLRFTYHVPVIKDGIVQSVEVKIPLRETCQLMPHWWSDQKKFVGRIIESTRYFQALNLSMNQTKKHFEIFDDENLIKIIKPFNGQIFVIFGCIVLAFPILLLLMFLRCLSGEEDLTEEAMFDLVEISIFCVFSVIEFYMSSGEEIRSIMDAMCGRYLEHSVIIDGFLKEKVYNICTNVKIEAYGFLSSGFIFLFLVFLFAIDLIILLKNAEEVESRKYLKMAACLHYDKPLEYMSELVLEEKIGT